ncbi:hypothetical protein BKG82_27220 [Mycobacteroides chelonae]|uniref:Uncharacterized protein n=2 Tax=Mycobacteroides chelonae TaxID=1774 RepID=A0A1S1LGR6_MYCCH|nr:hypothetical protein BKG82_27220 [Mycobacteroides chelonae]
MVEIIADTAMAVRLGLVPLSRIRRGAAALPAVTLTKADKQIQLIGVMHIADHRAWQLLNARLRSERAAGASIQFELLARSTTQPDPQMLRENVKYRALVRYLAIALGMQMQHQGLAMHSSWVHADLRLDEFVAATGGSLDRNLSLPDGVSDALVAAGRCVLLRSRRTRRTLMLAILGAAALVPQLGRFADIVLPARNRIAARSAELSTTTRTVSIWGAAHLPGIARLLTRAGWTVSGVSWWTHEQVGLMPAVDGHLNLRVPKVAGHDS